MPKGDKLTDKQEMFCKEYLIDLNATQAAIRAGYKEKTAKVTGNENLTKPIIQNRLQQLRAKREKRVQIDADWVLQQAMECYEETREIQEYNNAKGFLEMCGKHVNVGAFKEKKEIDLNANVDATVKVSPSKRLTNFLDKISAE